ncbi:general odorant-binding protein 56d-like isoform X2 [Neodiprion virginianus]|uniref:general odorant-binding protein 56d-like isoform X2 n=1 Tax=Neodiprion virginianus TaxID=2961670 RepID=UPI001EE71F77|nr:general odorant-binding protein 56d-like isoform X2 [Neodiprion virginianus]
MSTLIYGLVIAIFLFGKSMAMSDEMQEMAQMLRNTCVAETGVAEDLIIKCRSGDFTDDPKLKFDNGEIDVDTLVAMLPEEILGKAEPVLRSCGTIKGTDDCDSVYQTNKCYYDKSPLQMCTF